jgi:hypothetical protein
VFNGGTFSLCIDQNFEVAPLDSDAAEAVMVAVRANQVFLSELLFCCRDMFDRMDGGLGSATESDQRQRLIPVSSLYALYCRLLPPGTKAAPAFYLQLREVQQRVVVVPVCGRVPWYISVFLTTYTPLPVKRKELVPRDPFAFRKEAVKAMDSQLQEQRRCVSGLACC